MTTDVRYSFYSFVRAVALCLCLFHGMISNLEGLALRTHVESPDKPRDVNKRSQSLAW